MNDILKRSGIFKITRKAIRSNTEGVIEVLKDVLVVAINNDFIQDTLIYKGFSKYFDLIENGEVTPTYIAEIHVARADDGEILNIDIKWRRENEYSEQNVKSLLEEIREEIRKAKSDRKG